MNTKKYYKENIESWCTINDEEHEENIKENMYDELRYEYHDQIMENITKQIVWVSMNKNKILKMNWQ